MTPTTPNRPSRGQLQQRVRLAKRAVVVIAAASFGGLVMLAAGKSTAHGSSVTQTRQQAHDDGWNFFGNQNSDDNDNGSSDNGSLGDGSGQTPMAGSGAS